jgi:RNA polymerase sigma-70 factor (ECF subfamily)
MDSNEKQLRADRLDAFNAVVAHYEGALLRYAGRLVGASDAAQDIVQSTFIKLYRRWGDSMEPTSQMSSWLYRVAHNCAVDHVRNESRRRLLHLKHADESPASIEPDRGRGFRISEAAERAAGALAALSLRERQLVILKVYEEKSYKQISDITGLTVSNVGYILHHAMKKLAAELQKAKKS